MVTLKAMNFALHYIRPLLYMSPKTNDIISVHLPTLIMHINTVES